MVTIFEQGDIVYLDFDPQSGHEQKGRRPALAVSYTHLDVYKRQVTTSTIDIIFFQFQFICAPLFC